MSNPISTSSISIIPPPKSETCPSPPPPLTVTSPQTVTRLQPGEVGCLYDSQTIIPTTLSDEEHLNPDSLTDEIIDLIEEAIELSEDDGILQLSGPLPLTIGSLGANELARLIEGNTHITTLIVGAHDIGDEGISALARILPSCPSITLLNISTNRITPTGATALADVLPKCTKLSQLCLNYNSLGLIGMKSILDSMVPTQLSVLMLGGTNIGDVGAIYLSQLLPTMTKLTVIDLYGNEISEVGAMALVTPIQQSKSLESINLAMNQFSSTSLEAIHKAIQTNTRSSQITFSLTPTAHTTTVSTSSTIDSNSASASTESGTSFSSIYKSYCQSHHESPNKLFLYDALDQLWEWIEAQENKDEILKSLNEERLCIWIPVSLLSQVHPNLPSILKSDSIGYWDELSSSGIPLYASTPGLDSARVSVLSRMVELTSSIQYVPFDTDVEFFQWMIGRVEKVATIGWKEYQSQYL